jgi:G protein beta subunit-like protein
MQHGKELTDLQPRTKLQAHSKYLLRVLLAPSVKTLATCSADKTIKIWNLGPNGCTIDKTLSGHQRWVWDMAFSADSAYLVSASSDHTARLWEIQSGQTVKQYQGHHKAACTVALNDSA